MVEKWIAGIKHKSIAIIVSPQQVRKIQRKSVCVYLQTQVKMHEQDTSY